MHHSKKKSQWIELGRFCFIVACLHFVHSCATTLNTLYNLCMWYRHSYHSYSYKWYSQILGKAIKPFHTHFFSFSFPFFLLSLTSFVCVAHTNVFTFINRSIDAWVIALYAFFFLPLRVSFFVCVHFFSLSLSKTFHFLMITEWKCRYVPELCWNFVLNIKWFIDVMLCCAVLCCVYSTLHKM